MDAGEEGAKVNTYFDVGNVRFESREGATEQIKKWKADTTTFSVCEVQNTEVTRKTAKGDIITEHVYGSLERVPRIISARTLDPMYLVVDTEDVNKVVNGVGVSMWNKHFKTPAEAEQEREKRQGDVERRAALAEADIKEICVPTLADILERDEDKIDKLREEMNDTGKVLRELKKSKQKAHEIWDDPELQQAQEKFDAAENAYHEAIHYDEFEEEVVEKLQEGHNSDCWPDSDCRQCSYEPDSDEIEEYLEENAEEFEVTDEPNEPASENCSSQAA